MTRFQFLLIVSLLFMVLANIETVQWVARMTWLAAAFCLAAATYYSYKDRP